MCPPRVCFPGDSQSFCKISSLGNLLWTFATVQELLCYNRSPVSGSSAWQLYSGINGNLLQKDLCHKLHLPSLLQPEPLYPQQVTADPCLCRRHSNTQRQVWLSLLWGSLLLSLGPGVHKGFVCALRASLVGMAIDSKRDFSPPTILSGLLLCPWTHVIFFWWDPTFCQWLFSS